MPAPTGSRRCCRFTATLTGRWPASAGRARTPAAEPTDRVANDRPSARRAGWPTDKKAHMAVAEAYAGTLPGRGLAGLRTLRAASGRVSVGDRVGLVTFGLLVLAALAAPLLAPHDPTQPAGVSFALPFHPSRVT